MLKDIVEVKPLAHHHLYIRFEDGMAGELDLREIVHFDGVFAPLQDQAEFQRAYVDAELGTVCWPNGADLDPVVLYARVSGQPISYATQDYRR